MSHEFVIDEANEHIVRFVLKKDDEAKETLEREKRCGNPACIRKAKLEKEDAEDRINWATNSGEWRDKKLVVKKGKETFYIDNNGDFEKSWT